jgi:hypothetical protein
MGEQNYPRTQAGLMSGRRLYVKIVAESLSQHYVKHIVSTPLSGIRIGKAKIRDFKLIRSHVVSSVSLVRIFLEFKHQIHTSILLSN